MTGFGRAVFEQAPSGEQGACTHGRAAIARLRGSRLLQFALLLLLGAWFFIVFPTEPLYFDNQNTKFLHGMAAVGIGELGRDWTANTIDVMPVFTGIVYALHAFLPPWTCYLVQILLFAVFLYSIVRLAALVAGPAGDRPLFWVLIATITIASQFETGGARVWGGVAKQYLLGQALEPQSFGALFLLAVVVFVRRRTEAALLLAALPAIIHPGYVVPAGTLILAFLLAAHLAPDRSRRPRTAVALLSLAAAGASLVYLGLRILPTDAASWQAANQILARVRIPDHALPARWLDVDAAAKLAGLAVALWLVRRRHADLFRIAAACAATALVLTLAAAVLDSNALGIVSPWRISVYLVPLGLALLFGVLVGGAFDLVARGRRWQRAALRVLGYGLAAFALAVTARGVLIKIERYGPAPLQDHIAYMRADGGGSLYLTSPDDMDIRLQSRRAQLVSWKTHPYKDVEVLEWYRRVQLAEQVFRDRTIDCRALGQAIRRYGVTHLLVEGRERTVTCPSASLAFEGATARIFHLRR